ncbi:hypothetical protein U9M48_007601, partial [Paspalum notatum var. saurae]
MPPPAPPSPPPHVTSPPRPLAAFLASQVRRRRHSTAGLGRADGDSRWSSREGATAEGLCCFVAVVATAVVGGLD